MDDSREYYKAHGAMSQLKDPAALASELPREIARLCEMIQGILIHRDLAFAYGATFPEERQRDAHIRPAAEVAARIREIDGRPLAQARESSQRMVGVCRHFTLMLCAMLREQGVPARARCGFGAYFTPGRFEDHWLCEYWNANQARWILVDAQLDTVQRRLLNVGFDPLDVPRDRFVIAGDAWQMCRRGRSDFDLFGLSFVPQLRGSWFVAGNLIRDLAALNRMEMLPWDVWGMMPGPDTILSEETNALLDRLADLTLGGDKMISEARRAYESDDRLRVPSVVFNALLNAPEAITGPSRQ
jgi:hypothetical protein